MSRIVGPNRFNRGNKQSILFSQTQPSPPSYPSYETQDNIYNSFNLNFMESQNTQNSRESQNHHESQNITKPSRSVKRSHSRVPQSDNLQSDTYSGTLMVPENFTTVSINRSDLASIEAINTNASHRELSSSMYEDTNSHESKYKQNVINNMARDVLATAKYLCDSSNENRSYIDQMGEPITSSYGAHKMNMLAAKRIISNNLDSDDD